jgi:hypothetical protein
LAFWPNNLIHRSTPGGAGFFGIISAFEVSQETFRIPAISSDAVRPPFPRHLSLAKAAIGNPEKGTAAAEAPFSRSSVLARAHEDLEKMENGARYCTTCYCRELAAAPIQAILVKAVPEEGTGRPQAAAEVQKLVRTMAAANVSWAAPRIHCELLKLGFEISERTVSRLMPTQRKKPSQTWKTFLTNHVGQLVSIDFFTVSTLQLRVLFVFVVLVHERRRVVHFNVTEHPTAEWTAQQSG